jgi:hypothetical protein
MLTGAWIDLNWLGFSAGAAPPSLNTGLFVALGPLYFSKFLAPLSVLFLGVCAWIFFHRLGFSAGPSILAGLGMALNSNVFQTFVGGWVLEGLALGCFSWRWRRLCRTGLVCFGCALFCPACASAWQ